MEETVLEAIYGIEYRLRIVWTIRESKSTVRSWSIMLQSHRMPFTEVRPSESDYRDGHGAFGNSGGRL